MFADCRLGLKSGSSESYGKACRITPDDIDPVLTRCPTDWALGKPWDDDDLRNKKIGLCGPAAAVNVIKFLAAACGRTDVRPTADDAERFYRDVMGWDGTEANDDGVVLLDMMYQWMLHPIAGFKLDGFYVVSRTDAAHLASAVGVSPLIVSATLTRACQNTDQWDRAAADPRNPIWGPHAITYFSDSPGGGHGKSWGRPVWNTVDFRFARWNEVYMPVIRELMPHVHIDRLLAIGRRL